MPKISVCIPSYNHAHFLTDAIGSVLKQTYTDFELVVVDNCSTDNTAQLVQEYMATDSRVRYVRNHINVGPQNNLNRCLEVATGEYINILCADDLLEPAALQELIRAFDEHPGISLAGCARLIVNQRLRPIKLLSFSGTPKVLSGAEVIRMCLSTSNLIGEPSAVLFRTRDADRGFDTRYRHLIDLEMWFHLLHKGGFAFIPESLCRIRSHSEQLTRHHLESLSIIPDAQLILNEYVMRTMGASILLQHRWKLQIAFDVWAQQFIGMSFRSAHSGINEIYPLFLFYLLLPLKALTKIAPFIRARLAAWPR